MSVTPLGVSSGPRERSAQPHELSTSTELRVVRQPPSGVSRRREALAVAVPTLLLGLAVALVDGLTLLPLACAVLCAGLAGLRTPEPGRGHTARTLVRADSATAGLLGLGLAVAGVVELVSLTDVRWGLAVVGHVAGGERGAALPPGPGGLDAPGGPGRRPGGHRDLHLRRTQPRSARRRRHRPRRAAHPRGPRHAGLPALGQPRHRRGDGVLGRGRRGLRAARPRRRQRGRPPGLRSARSRPGRGRRGLPGRIGLRPPDASHRRRWHHAARPRPGPALGGRAAGQGGRRPGLRRPDAAGGGPGPGPPDAGHPRGQPWPRDLHADPGGPRRGAVPDVQVPLDVRRRRVA